MNNINKVLKDISSKTVDRYTKRYRELGYNVKTLGWGSLHQQEYRFKQTLTADMSYKSVIDIGCGFGDYYSFLKQYNIDINSYTGIDINSDLITQASDLHPDADFHTANLLETNISFSADIGVMLGVLNFNLKDSFDNYEYSKKFISKAFEMVNEVLIVDFLSTHLDRSYPKEDLVFYHDPSMMLEFALTLSNNVILKHDYKAIPQKEFMLFIYKEDKPYEDI